MKKLLLAGLLCFSGAAEPVVTIEAKPSEALIFVDRRLRGSGTVQLKDLTPGNYLLRVSGGEDWETHQQRLKVDSQPINLTIQLKPGAAKWLRLGHQALLYGDWAEAVHSFKQAAPSRPVAAAWWEGVSHWRAGQHSAALQSFRAYAQFMPQVPQLHWILGQINEQLAQPGSAFTAYKTAALTQPELSRALDKLPKPTEQAIAQLRARSAPADRLRLAQLLMLKGKMSEACALAKGVLGDRYQQDWLRWDPPLPVPPPIEVAPPEDLEP
jgi:tetratricopeptide (TPR) repeat protein